jgi:RNA polymerase sigma-70 factor (ECF subfamily)
VATEVVEPRWEAAELGREALAYADTLYNLARYLTRNATDAEDLVQETYTRALRAASQFTPGTNLKAWLFRILRNTFISLYRRQRHDPTVGGLDTVNPDQHDATEGEWLRGDRELDCLRAVVREEIEQALMSLSEDARTVVLLDLEDLSEQEIANVVSCAVGTVKSRLSRARAALRRQLSDYGRTDPRGRAATCSQGASS